MFFDKEKLDFALAERRMSASDLRDTISPATITRIRQGCKVGTKTAGKIAHALDMPLESLLEQKEV